MAVRKPAVWMVTADLSILEFLRSEGAASVTNIQQGLEATGKDLDYHHIVIATRCDLLTDAGLLEHVDGEYLISDAGIAFLAGDLDAGSIFNPRS